MIARPVVVLPQPDSPTMPSVSPRSTSRLIPVTALTTSPVRPIGNSTTRSSARSTMSSPAGRRWALPVPAISRLSVAAAVGPGCDAVRRRCSGDPTGYQQAYW